MSRKSLTVLLPFITKTLQTLILYSYGGYNITYSSARILELDKGNKVIKGQWQGNNCPGIYFRGKSWVNPKNDEWAHKKEVKKQEKTEINRFNFPVKAINNLHFYAILIL